MIVGNISEFQRVFAIHPGFKAFYDFIISRGIENLPKGRTDIDSDNVYVVSVDSPHGAEQKNQPLEMHQRYIDVHLCICGDEKIGWKEVRDINHLTKEYSSEEDCALSDDQPQFYVPLHPGQYCITFPEDAHAPAISDGPIRKLIGKIKV